MRRLASILLFLWVAVVTVATFGFCIGAFSLSLASVEAFTFGESVPYGTHQWRYVQHLTSWEESGNYDKNTNGFATMLSISTGSLVLGFIAGVLCVTLIWHWQRPRYLWVMIIPLAPALMLGIIYHNIPNYDGIRIDSMLHVLSQTGIQSLGILSGVIFGRKVSRAIVKAIIPPKPRQALAFLWRVDNLEPPKPG